MIDEFVGRVFGMLMLIGAIAAVIRWWGNRTGDYMEWPDALSFAFVLIPCIGFSVAVLLWIGSQVF